MNGVGPSASAAIGGAIARGSQRCAGHTTCGSSPVAPPSTSASVGVSSSGANDCTGLRGDDRDAARRASAAASAAATHVLPTSVPVPATTTIVTATVSGRADVAEHVGERGERAGRPASSVCAALSATRRRDVPGATVGGRIAGTSEPVLEQRGRRVERALLVAAHERHDRRRMAGPQRGRRSRAGARRARRPRPSARSAARRARPRCRPASARS